MKNLNQFNVSLLSEIELITIIGGCDDDWSWFKRIGCAIGNFFQAAGKA